MSNFLGPVKWNQRSNFYILLNFCANLIANLYNNYRILKLMNYKEYWQDIEKQNYRSCHHFKMWMASEACGKPRKIHCEQCEFGVMWRVECLKRPWNDKLWMKLWILYVWSGTGYYCVWNRHTRCRGWTPSAVSASCRLLFSFWRSWSVACVAVRVWDARVYLRCVCTAAHIWIYVLVDLWQMQQMEAPANRVSSRTLLGFVNVRSVLGRKLKKFLKNFPVLGSNQFMVLVWTSQKDEIWQE